MFIDQSFPFSIPAAPHQCHLQPIAKDGIKTGKSCATGRRSAGLAVRGGDRLRQTTLLHAMDRPMLTLRPKRRSRPCVEAIEPRDPPAGLNLAGLSAAVASSPVLSAARTAVLAYKVG